ncbi:MAG: fibronectin type III domain-containing protein [Microgenomates group bacterium]
MKLVNLPIFKWVVVLGVLIGLLIVTIWWKNRSVMATDRVMTTRADFETGFFENTETKSKEGEIRLKSAGTWGARVWQAPKVAMSNQTAIVSDGTYLYMMESTDRYFARYIPGEDRWQQLANAPHATAAGADLVIVGDNIYAIFGSYNKKFSRYSIANNSWVNLNDAPDLLADGASLGSDGTYIYLLRGSYTSDYWRYDPTNSTWMSLGAPPATIGRGASLSYKNGYFYTPRGDSNSFYRYQVSTNLWTTLPNIPAPNISYAPHNSDIFGDFLYYNLDYGSTAFYRFDLGTTTWSTLPGTPWPTYYVGVVGVGNTATGYVYVFRGNGSYDFWKYNPRTNSFEGSVDTPNAPSTGADLLYDGSYLYMNRGANSANMYRYTIGGTWQTMADAPAYFGDDVKGINIGSSFYYLRGIGTTAFYKFDPSVGVGGTWTNLLGTPSTVNYGASIIYPGSGSYLYATRGALTRTFWRYTIGVGETWSDAAATDLPDDAEAGYGARLASDGTDIYYMPGSGMSKLYKYTVGTTTWSVISNIPFAPYYGSDVSYYNGKLYFLAGYYKPDFWEYTIASASWRRLAPTQDYGPTEIGPWAGASIESLGNGTFYVILGNGVTRLLTYTVDAGNYPSSGGWTSSAIDFGYVASWSSLQIQSTLPGDSSISFATRSSSDKVTWTDWVAGVGSSIGSAPLRYLQIGVTMVSTSDGSQTPSLLGVTVNYVGDTGVPIGPNVITGMSQQVAGIGLTSGENYDYQSPYFSFVGATDPETSVAGYYVYFGTGSSANPVVEGNYQTLSNYVVTTPMDQLPYYLRLVTVDGVGNTSAAMTGFVYNYNGISPPLTLTKSLTSDFGLGTTSNFDLSGDQMKLLSKPGFWEQERISSLPAGIYYGGSWAYKASTNKMYLFRGYGSNIFYIYDLTTNTVSVGPTAPGTVYYGGGLAEGPGNYIYAMRGYGTNGFWRFDVGTTTWSDVAAADVTQTISYGASMRYDGSRYIYAIRGSGDDALMRYDTIADAWETLANVDFNAPINQPNNVINDGGDLAYDGADTLYVLQGGARDGFASYSISGNSWMVLPDLPAYASSGSQLTYDGATNSLYYLNGLGRNFFYKFDINSQTWSELAETPIGVSNGSSLKMVNGSLYMSPGGGSAAMYKYNIAKNSWLIPTVGVFGGWFRGSDSRGFGYGADIILGDGNNLYLTRGNYDNLFVRYNSATGVATKMADLPAGIYLGAELVYDSVHSRIYATVSNIYRKFYVYDIASDSWSEEIGDPPPVDVAEGSSMIFNPTDKYIYWLRGGGTQTFYRFNTEGVGTSKWSILPNTGLTISYGSDMVLKNDYIYTLRGGNTLGFTRYGPLSVGATWSDVSVADLPVGANIYNDGFLVDLGGDYLMACRGGNQNTCYRYSITGNSWSLVSSVTAPYITAGGAATVDASGDKVYVIAGSGQLNTFGNGLYTYVISGANSSFEESGNYISPVYDLTAVYKFASLTVETTMPGNTDLSVYTRTSADNVTWGDWVVASEQKTVGMSQSYKINSTVSRYLQIKLGLTSSNGVHSGVINSYSVNYYQDTVEPINPDNYSSTVVSGVWNNSTAPVFSWSGASDGVNGSGIKGYYVYFGLGETADPVSLGTYTTATSLVGTSLTSGQTYYFRMKTIDNANNVTAGVGTTYVYKFDNETPINPTAVLADPPGYTTTDNFTFTWGSGTDTASGISAYCYKTETTDEQCITDVGVTGVTGITKYQSDENIFYLRVKDAAGNFASSYLTAIYKYSGSAPSRPTNLRLTYPSVGTSNSENDFAFAWDQPESFLGAASNLVYKYSINELPTPSNVITVGTNVRYLSRGQYATRKGVNTIYVVVSDEAGNISTSEGRYQNYASLDFEASTSAPGVSRNLDISDVSIKETNSWRLALSWDAPEASGSGIASYKVYRSTTTSASCSSDFTDFSYASSTTGTSFIDTNLLQSKYYYCVKACDSTSECSAVSSTVSLLPDGKWRVPPTLTAEPTSSVKTKTATISWSTNRKGNSFVKYGKSAGSYGEEVGSSELLSSHEIALTGLDPGTTYYYKATWTDEDGNTGESTEYSLTTNPAPVVSTVSITDIGLYSVYVKFGLSNASKATIQYGKTTIYGSVFELTTSTSSSTYTSKLDGLEEGMKYHLKIVAEDEEGNKFTSDDYEFSTLPMPKIEGVKIQQVKGMSTATIMVSWKTNTGVSSIVSYYPTGRPEMTKDQVGLTLSQNHQLLIKDLLDDTDYIVIVKGKDYAGNEAKSSQNKFKTSADLRPPLITDMRAEGAINGVGEVTKAQIMVYWNTDEPATSQIEYGEGTGTDYPNRTQEDGNLTMNHVVTVTDLKPSQVYHLRIISRDRIGNQIESADNVTVTPKATKSALDLVVNSLSKSFGFFGGLGKISQ